MSWLVEGVRTLGRRHTPAPPRSVVSTPWTLCWRGLDAILTAGVWFLEPQPAR